MADTEPPRRISGNSYTCANCQKLIETGVEHIAEGDEAYHVECWKERQAEDT